MPLLAFIVVAALVVAGPLVWMALRLKLRPGETSLVLIWHANSEIDKEMTLGALRSAGIRPHVVDSGPPHPYELGNVGPVVGSRYEIWVPARDEARARGALGL